MTQEFNNFTLTFTDGDVEDIWSLKQIYKSKAVVISLVSFNVLSDLIYDFIPFFKKLAQDWAEIPLDALLRLIMNVILIIITVYIYVVNNNLDQQGPTHANIKIMGD